MRITFALPLPLFPSLSPQSVMDAAPCPQGLSRWVMINCFMDFHFSKNRQTYPVDINLNKTTFPFPLSIYHWAVHIGKPLPSPLQFLYDWWRMGRLVLLMVAGRIVFTKWTGIHSWVTCEPREDYSYEYPQRWVCIYLVLAHRARATLVSYCLPIYICPILL